MRSRILILDSLLLGVVGALSAQVFIFLLRVLQEFLLNHLAGYHPPGLPHEGEILKEVIGMHGLWLIPVVTTIGGLVSGILVYSLAPEAEGHGTDAFLFFRWMRSVRGRAQAGSEQDLPEHAS